MAYHGRLVMKFTNDAVNALNYQLVDFDFNNTVGDVNTAAASCLAYMYLNAAAEVLATNTRIVGIDSRPVSTSGSTPVPFPVAAYAALVVIDPRLPPASTYVGTIGVGALCPLGTSISVSEVTAHAGPTGRGRHFLPFISRNSVNAGGQVAAAVLGEIDSYYEDHIMGGLLATPNNPVVTGVGSFSIIAPRAQPVYSNLESRRR